MNTTTILFSKLNTNLLDILPRELVEIIYVYLWYEKLTECHKELIHKTKQILENMDSLVNHGYGDLSNNNFWYMPRISVAIGNLSHRTMKDRNDIEFSRHNCMFSNNISGCYAHNMSRGKESHRPSIIDDITGRYITVNSQDQYLESYHCLLPHPINSTKPDHWFVIAPS